MAGEPDTLLSSGTDNATLTQTDDDNGFIEFDPFNTDNDDEEIGGTGAEPDEDADQGQSDEEPEAKASEDDEKEAEADDEDADSKKGDDDVTVKLPTGEEVALEELKKGYLRQADFSRKTQDLANSRKSVTEQADRISRVADTLVDYLSKQIPPEPSIELAYQDPNAYVAQKAHYEQSLARVRDLIAIADAPKEALTEVEKGIKQERLAEQNRLLAEAMPMTATEKGRGQFFSDVLKGAQAVGYTEADMRAVEDHRLLTLGYWAAKGMEAEKAKEAAKAKVAQAPAAQPPKRAAKPVQATSEKYDFHIRRAAKTGSLDDVINARLARLRSS